MKTKSFNAKFSVRSRNTCVACITFFLLTFLIIGSEALAATYYVSPTGNDSTGNGSSVNRWKTIQKCADSAGAGDTCIIGDGIYTSQNNQLVSITKSGSSSAWITFQAENKWGAVLSGQ